MTPVEIGILLVSWVFLLSLGFVLGFYWLQTQLDSSLEGIVDVDMDEVQEMSEQLQEASGDELNLGGELDDEF